MAFVPALASISGGLNPDAMLCAVAAALFYCLARAFRRGLTERLAIAIGLLTAVGLLTKLNFLGLIPGVALAAALLGRRLWAARGRRAALRALVPLCAIAAAPPCVYALVNVLSHHHTLGIGSGVIAVSAQRSLLGELSYIWQLYLPRLPGMHVDFADISPLRNLWFHGLVGEYGFEDTFLPGWADTVALLALAPVIALAAREALARRHALPVRTAELSVYLVVAAGLLLLIRSQLLPVLPHRSRRLSRAPLPAAPAADLRGPARARDSRRRAPLGSLRGRPARGPADRPRPLQPAPGDRPLLRLGVERRSRRSGRERPAARMKNKLWLLDDCWVSAFWANPPRLQAPGPPRARADE